METIILLAVVVGAYILIMPLVAFLKANGLARDIQALKAEIAALKSIQPKPRKSKKSVAEKASEPIKVAPVEKTAAPIAAPPPKLPPAKPPTAKAPNFFDRAFASFQANWIIWVAALSLAFGGLFFVQYGLEHGYLGPVARVLCALGFGAALIAVAEYLRRKPNIGMQGWFTVPVALAAGGIASLFAGVVSAHLLYGLTSALVGFASMVVVSILAIFGGWIYGPVLAVIGILGAYISPMLITGGESSPILYLYFLVILATSLMVERLQRWIWLSALAVGFTLFWGIILFIAPYFTGYIVATILAASTILAFGFWPKWDGTTIVTPASLKAITHHYPTILSVATALTGTILLWLGAHNGLMMWQLTLMCFTGLTLWAIFICARAQNLDQLALIFAGGLIATIVDPQLPLHADAHYFGFVTAPALITGAGFLIAGFWRMSRSVRPLYWVAASAIAPVATYAACFARWYPTAQITDVTWAFFAILLSAILALSAILMLRSKLSHRMVASDLYFTGMLAALAFAAYLSFEHIYLSHIAALLSLGALVLTLRFKYFWTDLMTVGFVAISSSMMIGDLLPNYSQDQPILMVFLAFGTLIGFLYIGYLLASEAKRPARVILYETAGILTLAILICALIWRTSSGSFAKQPYMVMGIYATVLGLMAGVQYKRLSVANQMVKLRRWLANGYAILGLCALALACLLTPLFGFSTRGYFPLDTVMIAYALPMITLYGLYYLKLLPPLITPKILYSVIGFFTVFITIQEIRRFWHGNRIDLSRGVAVGELYTYTILLLVATVGVIFVALSRKSPVLRKIGLGLAALTAAKVFLFDTAGMQGLARATVFIVLGLTLAGVGWVLQMKTADDKNT